jgi:capsid protein
MFRAIKRLFSPAQTGPWFRVARARGEDARKAEKPYALRRWDAGKTDRLNTAHWGPVTGRTINLDLKDYQERIRTRAEFELANNADAEGVVVTHQVDVVGDDGPTLQVLSDSPEYNAAVEKLWRDWWAKPDINGQLSGVDLLDLWLRSLWSAGEYLVQIMVDQGADGPIKTRLLNLHPRRLGTPVQLAGELSWFLGVKRSKTGKPLRYAILVSPEAVLQGALPTEFDEIDEKDIIHGFIHLEAGQVRGVPWMTTPLQAVADLRDYDNQVLDAARAAADHGVMLTTTHPDAAYVEVNESAEIERRMITTAPPGWQMSQMTPQQPATGYVDYHDEQMRKLGRPVSMPLMTIKLDSRKHNYSSARFDGQMYQRSTSKKRAWLARTTLNRLVDLIAREAELAGVLPAKPAELRYRWNWPPFPHVDPTKESKASTERLKNATSCVRDEYPGDWEELFDQQQREAEAREARNLPPLADLLGVKGEPEAEEPEPPSKKGEDND